jgi:sugar phosphate isomerase/epimerase
MTVQAGRANVGIITDELTQDLGQALEFISSYGLRWCELREVWGKNVIGLSQPDLDRAKNLLAQKGVRVSGIASPIFKWNLPAMPAAAGSRDFETAYTEEDADALLEKVFRIADFFGTRHVRIFSYWRLAAPERAFPMIRDRLSKAAQLAAKNGIVLLLENEHACNIGTGRELGRLLREVNSPNLRGIWDPGNALVLGETPFPNGYEEVKGLFPHMHIKDARTNVRTGKLEWVPVGGGAIDFKGQFQALREEGYSGTMSLETHYRRPDGDKVESTRESLEGLLRVLC